MRPQARYRKYAGELITSSLWSPARSFEGRDHTARKIYLRWSKKSFATLSGVSGRAAPRRKSSCSEPHYFVRRAARSTSELGPLLAPCANYDTEAFRSRNHCWYPRSSACIEPVSVNSAVHHHRDHDDTVRAPRRDRRSPFVSAKERRASACHLSQTWNRPPLTPVGDKIAAPCHRARRHRNLPGPDVESPKKADTFFVASRPPSSCERTGE